MIIATIAPNNSLIPFDFVKCLLALKNCDVYFWQGASLPYNRNKCFQYARSKNDDLLFIDSDMVFTPNDVLAMQHRLADGYDIVCGAYAMGTPPYPQAIFKRIVGDYELIKPQTGLYEVGAGGTGFMAISKQVVAQMPADPFDYFQEGEVLHGDDVSFCHRAGQHGFKVWCDQGIKVGHLRLLPIYPND
jgi:glycosyltransferase involved in cell wall biosynthesis